MFSSGFQGRGNQLTVGVLLMLSIVLALSISTPSEAPEGWSKLDSVNTFNDVAVTREEHAAIVADGSAPFWGGTGSRSAFIAWTSAAFDQQNQTLYFFGGGHSNYGGNEIYSFDLVHKQWSRVSEPSPLTIPEAHWSKADTIAYLPEQGPLSTHTYDNFEWNPVTNTIWYVTDEHGFGGENGIPSHAPSEAYLWQFDPENAAWSKTPFSQTVRRGKSVYLPELQQTLIIDSTYNRHTAFLIDNQGNEANLGQISQYNGSDVGNLVAHPQTGQVFSFHRDGVYELQVGINEVTAVKLTDAPTIASSNLKADLGQIGVAYRPADGLFYLWFGGQQVMTWNSESYEFATLWNVGSNKVPPRDSAGYDKVFDKFFYIPNDDVFVGVSDPSTENDSGVWVYRPRENQPVDFQVQNPAPVVDAVTLTSASITVPFEGDMDFDATGIVSVKPQGQQDWSAPQEMFRINPMLVRNTKNDNTPSPNSLATIVTGLEAGVTYDVKVNLQDQDGIVGNDTFIMQVTTDQLFSEASRIEEIESDAQWQAVAKNLQAGTTYVLQPGLYSQVTLKGDGTEQAPIVIKGSEGAVIDAGNEFSALTVKSSHIRISNLTIQNAKIAINVSPDVNGVQVTGNRISDVDKGIRALGGVQQVVIADNTLAGRNQFGDISNATWSDEGIVVTGNSIEVSGNTVQGFGDSIGLHWSTNIANVGINIHNNTVLYGGDDGIEFDFATRNVAVHNNLIANTASGLSFQPVWGGPVYAFNNVAINFANTPLKIKPEKDSPSGMFIFNNTFIKGLHPDASNKEELWVNNSGDVTHLYIRNNYFGANYQIGERALRNNSAHALLTMANNSWSHDGSFTIKGLTDQDEVSVASFAEWTQSQYGQTDKLIALEDAFENPQAIYDVTFSAAVAPTWQTVARKAAVKQAKVGASTEGNNGSAAQFMEMPTEEYQTGSNGAEYIDQGQTEQPAEPKSEPVNDQHVFEGTKWRDEVSFADAATAMTINGNGGHDIITATPQGDVIDGGVGSDTIAAGEGDDTIIVGSQEGFDDIDGGAGFDQILGAMGDTDIQLVKVTNVERIDLQSGYNTITFTRYKNVIDFSATELVDVALIDLGAGYDEIIGSNSADVIMGGDQNDVIDGHYGADTAVYAGNEADYRIIKNADNSLTVTALATNEGTDTLLSIEYIRFADGIRSVKQL